MRTPALASAALLLSGCITLTSIDNHAKPPAEWPELQEVVQVESFMRVQQICRTAPFLLVGVYSRACTIPVLPYGAYIIVTYDPNDTETMAHERLHGKGYGHGSDNWPNEVIAYWRSQGWKPGDTPLHFDVLRYDPQQNETVKVTGIQ